MHSVEHRQQAEEGRDMHAESEGKNQTSSLSLKVHMIIFPDRRSAADPACIVLWPALCSASTYRGAIQDRRVSKFYYMGIPSPDIHRLSWMGKYDLLICGLNFLALC